MIAQVLAVEGAAYMIRDIREGNTIFRMLKSLGSAVPSRWVTRFNLGLIIMTAPC
jgi:hypothetical protein